MTTLRLRAYPPQALPALVVALLLTACGPGPSSVGSGQRDGEQAGRPKTLNIALTTNPNAMSVMSYGTPTGGWGGLHELHSDGLVTTGRTLL